MTAGSPAQVYRPVYREAGDVNLLTVHLWVAFLVAALAVLAVWQLLGRRITLYVLTLQILLGIVLMVQGLKVPWYHPALAVLGWAGYMVANALSRREGGRRNALIVAGIASLLILIAYYAGMEAVKHGYAG
jgi:phosphoglycerol transferase MdoB-like AlkP superfamily enzyme